MSQRGNKKKRYTMQILWIVAALIATAGLLIGYKLGFGKDGKDDKVVNAAGNNVNVTQEAKPTVSITPEATPTEEAIAPTTVPSDNNIVPEDQKENEAQENNNESNTPSNDNNINNNTPSDNEEDKTQTPQADNTVKPDNTTEEPDDKTDTDNQQPSEQKMIALTFDDGPYPPVTSRLLKTLKDNDSVATFFVMGNRMETYAETVKAAYEQGCQIGNHTFDHKDLAKLSAAKIKKEVADSNNAINKNVPVGDAYVRPPYGSKNDTVKENVNVPLICWSVDTLDWKTKNADSVYKEIMDHVQDGDILLMHDLYPTTADAMEKVIPELIKQGYKLVTVQELLEAKGITPEAGKVYHNAR